MACSAVGCSAGLDRILSKYFHSGVNDSLSVSLQHFVPMLIFLQ